jgi:SAM-dependent methyltransferase
MFLVAARSARATLRMPRGTSVKMFDAVKRRASIPYPLGRVAFWGSVLVKKFSLLRGGWSQRAVEYPWVLRQLNAFVPKGARVLDVGCSESLLSHELLARGYEVWGIDINDYPYKPAAMVFVKRDARDTDLPSNFFDAVVCVSTIEHIGLPVYGQEGVDLGGDIKAVREFRRILKPGGYLILTTPFAGKKFRLVPGERQYDLQRLQLLTQGFEIICEDTLIPYKLGKRIIWLKISANLAKKINTGSKTPGLLCFVARKL